MGYGIKYRGDFYDASNTLCRIDILQDSYSGTINELIFSDTPVLKKLDSQNKPIYDAIKTSSLEINLLKSYFTQYDDFQNRDDKEFLVRLYIDGILDFEGWLITAGIVEPYRSVPYILSLQIVDGINRLKDVDFVLPSNTYTRPFYNDWYYMAWRVTMRDIMAQVMANLPDNYTLINYSNLLCDDGTVGYPIISPSNYINLDLVKDKSLYECLEFIVKNTGSKLVVEGAKVKIFTLKEQEIWANNGTTTYIEYDSTFTQIDSGNVTINRLTIGDELKLLTGGTITKNPAAKEVTINVDYGLRNNCFIPGDFTQYANVNNGVIELNNWFKAGNTGVYGDHIDAYIIEDKDEKYLKLVGKNDAGSFGECCLFTKIRFKDLIPDVATSKNGKIRITLDSKVDLGTYAFLKILNSDPLVSPMRYLRKPTTYWLWDTITNFVDIPRIPTSRQDDWYTATIDFDVNSADTLYENDLYIFLGCFGGPSPWITYYKNIRISFINVLDDNSITTLDKGENLTVVNNATGLFSSQKYELKLASIPATVNGYATYNPMMAYSSALVIERTAPDYFVMQNVYHSSDDSIKQPLQDYIGRLIAGTATISQSVISCSLMGKLLSWLTPIMNVEEPNKIYFIGSGNYDVKRNRGNYELLQYVAYIGDDWDRILTEDSSFILAENDDELITEING